MASLELKSIVKSFVKDQEIIKGFNLKIDDGEFIVLVGPSGCGKSTLLRIVAGLETSTEGEVYIGTTLVNDMPPKDRNIAMVFQNYALYPHMNVFDNLAFGLKLRKVPKPEIKERVSSAAAILEIGNLLKRKPKELSGGQRQRVALGRSIVRDPQVFLFDEPLSNLDAKLRVQMRAEIKKLHRQLRTTMIYVTHDQVEAMTMGDRIVILKDGMIQQVGSPMEIYHNPANLFVAGFIGSPSMNLIKGKIADRKFISNGLTLDISLLGDLHNYEGKQVFFGIRPENIHVESGDIELPILVTEPLGHETVFHLKSGSDIIVAKVQAEEITDMEDSTMVDFELQKAYLFDGETEERIHC